MKGLILAGGLATRLWPLTLVTNKHLLPVYNKPMIFYPLMAMQKAGIKEVLLTTSGDQVKKFKDLLKEGKDFNLKISYGVQKNPKGGIADALSLARNFTKNENLLVILGDNIFNFNLKSTADYFNKKKKGAMVFGVKMPTDSGQYGVIEIDKDNNVLSIEEKPQKPKSRIAQTGIYMYDNQLFQLLENLAPSKRGELEVTDLNNLYVKKGLMECQLIDWWIDAGTSYDELLRANNLICQKVKQGEI